LISKNDIIFSFPLPVGILESFYGRSPGLASLQYYLLPITSTVVMIVYSALQWRDRIGFKPISLLAFTSTIKITLFNFQNNHIIFT